MTFQSDLEDAAFDEQLKGPITAALISQLKDFNLTSANVQWTVKQDKVALVTFTKKMNEEEAQNLISAIGNTEFQKKFRGEVNENSVDVTLETISDPESSK